MYLLDTNVVSELRKPKPHGAVLAWITTIDNAQLHLSSVTIGEIQAGIEITREQNPQKALEIEAWLELISSTYNVVPMGSSEFRMWARLMHHKSDALYEDAMIAAIATVHNLTVVTRNITDPFQSSAAKPTCCFNLTNLEHPQSSRDFLVSRALRMKFYFAATLTILPFNAISALILLVINHCCPIAIAVESTQ
jgi:toxin FitB